MVDLYRELFSSPSWTLHPKIYQGFCYASAAERRARRTPLTRSALSSTSHLVMATLLRLAAVEQYGKI
jgi:hypothetical protein